MNRKDKLAIAWRRGIQTAESLSDNKAVTDFDYKAESILKNEGLKDEPDFDRLCNRLANMMDEYLHSLSTKGL